MSRLGRETTVSNATASLLPLSEPAAMISATQNRAVSQQCLDLSLIDPFSSDWDCLVGAHRDSTFFHTSAWAKVLHKTYGHTPAYLQLSRRSEIKALVPLLEIRSAFTGHRGVCLPFSDFCYPLIFAELHSASLLNGLMRFARSRNLKYVEVRGRTVSLAPAIPSATFYGHQLDLTPDLRSLFASFSSANRRAIRKAEKSNLKIEITRSLHAVSQFYRLHISTRKRHGLPPQPFSFFQNIHKEIFEQDLGFIVLAQIGLRSAAAAIFFQAGNSAIYKFGASDEALQDLRPNNLVMWEAIKFLVQKGSKTLHFGRTSLENEGLRRFKLSWGTKEEKIDYFRFGASPGAHQVERDRASGFHNKLFCKLPLALNRLAGALIYPHLD